VTLWRRDGQARHRPRAVTSGDRRRAGRRHNDRRWQRSPISVASSARKPATGSRQARHYSDRKDDGRRASDRRGVVLQCPRDPTGHPELRTVSAIWFQLVKLRLTIRLSFTSLTGSSVAGRCRASFPGRTPELRAEILRQPAALDGLHQIGDCVEMQLLQGSQVSQELRRRSSQP
jgi:hypothetical protein